jgi:acetyl esterase/lipase
MVDDVIRLYEGRPEGSQDWAQTEAEAFSPSWGTEVVVNVVDPTLLVYRADPARSTGSAVVICPGGGFHGLSINSEGIDVARWLAERGVTAFVLKYRLVAIKGTDPGFELFTMTEAERHEACEPVIPLALADGLTAMTWVREHAAAYGVDPERVGIIGFSAGGTVSASVAHHYTPASRPAFVGTIYLQYEWAIKGPVPADAPPLFALVATDDQLGLAPHSLAIYSAWVAAGASAELHVLAAGGHGFGMRTQGLPSDRWIESFGSWLQGLGLMAS